MKEFCITAYKFSGAGNDFVVLDGRRADVSAFRHPARITALCREFRTDGLMILGPRESGPDMSTPDAVGGAVGQMPPGPMPSGPDVSTPDAVGGAVVGGAVGPGATAGPIDFTMEFFNPDGSGGMMCGNGGRCIVAFADYLGLKPASADGIWHFLAPDGLHTAEILSGPAGSIGSSVPFGPAGPSGPFGSAGSSGLTGPADSGGPAGGKVCSPTEFPQWTVRLKMIDVQGIRPMMGGYFLNTGTRHFVKFVPDIEGIDMEKDGPEIRWADAFQPEGTNANFVEVRADGLHVRTFEKGVEAETLACGTGLAASALAAHWAGIPGLAGNADCPAVAYRLQCRRGDWLQVDFRPAAPATTIPATAGSTAPAGPAATPDRFTDVYLTGPAELVRVVQLTENE